MSYIINYPKTRLGRADREMSNYEWQQRKSFTKNLI